MYSINIYLFPVMHLLEYFKYLLIKMNITKIIKNT